MWKLLDPQPSFYVGEVQLLKGNGNSKILYRKLDKEIIHVSQCVPLRDL